MTIFKRNLEFSSPQEQLYEINSLINSLNNINFNFTFYAVNKKYSVLSELNKLKKNILNNHYQCKKTKYSIGNSLSYFSNFNLPRLFTPSVLHNLSDNLFDTIYVCSPLLNF